MAHRLIKGTIPADRWTEPYMSREKLQKEIDEGVVFWGYEEGGELAGVMGIQEVRDVDAGAARLCAHEQPEARNWGKLLSHLRELAKQGRY